MKKDPYKAAAQNCPITAQSIWQYQEKQKKEKAAVSQSQQPSIAMPASFLAKSPRAMHNAGQYFTYKFKLKADYVKADGTSALHIQAFLSGQQIRINTGINLPPKLWNAQKEKVIGKSRFAVDANLFLDDYRSRLADLRLELRLKKKKIPKNLFIARVREAALNIDFLAYYAWRLNLRQPPQVADNTHRKEKSVLNILRHWRGTMPFSDLSEDMIYDFIRYMKDVRQSGVSTLHKNTKVLGHYLRMAQEDGFEFDMPTKALRSVSPGDGRIHHLSKAELQQGFELYRKTILPAHLQSTLGAFLFACCTGLRHSDLQAFTRQNIVNQTIVLATKKGRSVGRIVQIPLSNAALQFLQPQEEKPLGRVNQNQPYNKNLKAIQKYWQVSVPLTSHVARHTFATLFLESGGAIDVLQKLLGHAKIDQTMIYAHVTDSRKRLQIDNFDSMLK